MFAKLLDLFKSFQWSSIILNSDLDSLSDFLFISRANQHMTVFSVDYVPYRCVRYVQITENSYYYYILAGTYRNDYTIVDTSK